MFSFNNKSILSKIQFIQIITLIGSFVGVFLILSTILNNHIHENHKKYLKQLSHSIKNDISHSIPMYKSYLLNISEDQYIQDYHRTLEETNLARFLIKSKDIFPYLSIITKDGNEIYRQHNKVIYNGFKNYKKQALFSKILKSKNKVIVSNVLYDQAIQEYVIYFAIHMKNHSNNGFEGILLATIPIKEFIRSKVIDKNIISQVLTNDDYIVYSSSKKEIGIKKSLKDINSHLTLHCKIINEDILLALSYPNKIINAQIYEILIMIGLIFVFVIIIALALIYRENKKVMEPIKILTKAINNVSKGQFSSKLEIPREQELKPIAKSFNKMIKELNISELEVKKNKEILEKLNQSFEIEISKQHKSLKDKDKILFQKAKLASMGEMIDTILHQWRQPLSIISTIASATLVKLNYEVSIDKEELLKNSNQTMTQIKHLDATIDEFRHFFREDNNFEVLPIKECIQSALRLINNHIMQNGINIDLNIEEDLLIELIPNEFKHVIINLINNSIDAFIEKKVENPQLSIKALKKNNQIELQITDNAGGISEKVLSSIFLANITTKGINKGTGIGLYITTQILRKINATITAKNIRHENDTNGAQFTILFPTVIQS